MSGLVQLNWDPDTRVLRQFGYIALCGFGGLALCAWFEVMMFSAGLGTWRMPVAGGLAGLGVVSALSSVVYPRANRGLYVGLSLVTYPIGYVLSYVILTVLYFGLFTPVGFLLRVVGKDSLSAPKGKASPSFWVGREKERSKEDYFRQF